MPSIFYPVILALGGAVGVGVGIVTRPTVLGFPIPLGVLTSDHPLDQAAREALIGHLTTYGKLGLGLALIVVLLAYARHAALTPHAEDRQERQ